MAEIFIVLILFLSILVCLLLYKKFTMEKTNTYIDIHELIKHNDNVMKSKSK